MAESSGLKDEKQISGGIRGQEQILVILTEYGCKSVSPAVW